MPTRTPEQIRASIELNRQELGTSIAVLRKEVTALTDWRQQLRDHRREALVTAVVAGFVIGGGIAGVSSLVFGRRKRRRR
ncbi:MAG TPA: DUF3618 domain-containing protein [Conexibacter sp.]|nr:DUF3618 domain-containing protein [Conexibacter sp.]